MSAAASSKNLGARLWSSYNRQLDARPLVTKSFTSFFGFIVGDGVAQVASGEKYDYWRTARFATYGILVHGPLSHVWYGILDKNVMPRTPKRAVRQNHTDAERQVLAYTAGRLCCVAFGTCHQLSIHPELTESPVHQCCECVLECLPV
ncbi:TPA: hypothetical protein ACH3X2_010521 [Trebouxia sp. C0005]